MEIKETCGFLKKIRLSKYVLGPILLKEKDLHFVCCIVSANCEYLR